MYWNVQMLLSVYPAVSVRENKMVNDRIACKNTHCKSLTFPLEYKLKAVKLEKIAQFEGKYCAVRR